MVSDANKRIVGYFATIVTAAACLPCAGSYAQETQSTASTPAPSQTGSGIEGIVVTAERRAERLQDVPLSVTALTPQTLAMAGITNSADLSMVTPGLHFNEGGLSIQPEIRGITTINTYVTADPDVATYVDGVYQSTMFGSIYELPDVDQVQVLKGPQGTLFGRNATGGAILIDTLNPDLTKPTGQIAVGYGNYNSIVGQGYVSTPIVVDKLAASLTAYVDHTDGWVHNILDDNKEGGKVNNYLVRGKVRFDPSDNVDFVLSGYWEKRIDYLSFATTNLNGNNIAEALGYPASEIASKPYQYSLNLAPYYDGDQKAVSLRGNINVGPGTLTTTTAYTQYNAYILVDGDGGPANLSVVSYPAVDKTFEQELVYTTNQLDKFHGTAGVFYLHNSGGEALDINDFLEGIYTNDVDNAYAVFGELTYDLTNQLSITGGARYSYEKKRAYAALTLGTPTPPSSLPLLGEKGWGSATPRVSLLYKATDRTNLYFTYSQGFKSGAFNTVAFQTTPVNPEKVNSYEGGIKSAVTDDLSLNAAGFHYDYTGLQIPTILNINGAFTQILQNATNAQISGGEVSGSWNITHELNVAFGGTYLHARYSSFPDAVVDVPTGVGGNVAVSKNISGYTMIGAPTWTNNVTATYTKDTNVGIFNAAATLFYSTKVYWDIGDRITQNAYAMLNASLTWRPSSNSNWQVKLWGKNLTDHPVILSTVIQTLADEIEYAPPRTFGGEIKYSF